MLPQLSNSYEFSNNCCFYRLYKTQICTIKNLDINENDLKQLSYSATNLNQNGYSSSFDGILFFNVKQAFCCGIFACPWGSSGIEINGFNRKLTETMSEPGCDCYGCCFNNTCCNSLCPVYEVKNTNEQVFGKIKPDRCFLHPACARVETQNINTQNIYYTKRHCFNLCCSINWDVTDITGQKVSQITSTCFPSSNYRIIFLKQLSFEDKLLLMTTIPFAI